MCYLRKNRSAYTEDDIEYFISDEGSMQEMFSMYIESRAQISFIELYIEFEQSEADRNILRKDYNSDSEEELTEPEEEKHKKNLQERIDEVCVEYKLTPREKEFIELIYSGKSNKEIAEILFLSESTVKTHIYNIFRKMNVKSRVGVIYIVNEENEDELPRH